MRLGIVIGKVWSTKKVDELKGCILHVVQPISSNNEKINSTIVVADPLNIASIGDKVVYVTNTDAAQAFDSGYAAVDASIVELVDEIS